MTEKARKVRIVYVAREAAGGPETINTLVVQQNRQILRLRLEIDPADASSNDDKYTLFSTDANQTYRKTLTAKDDKIDGDKYIDLEFKHIDKNLNYTMEVDPGADEDKYYLFEDMSLKNQSEMQGEN